MKKSIIEYLKNNKTEDLIKYQKPDSGAYDSDKLKHIVHDEMWPCQNSVLNDRKGILETIKKGRYEKD